MRADSLLCVDRIEGDRAILLAMDGETYVVPIPYYDRKPNGALGEFHYEGNDFPDNVPITHYHTYNLAGRKPDVIYIHNPYDKYNTVTSVDPRFYSFELKTGIKLFLSASVLIFPALLIGS